jgi:hypothetical protein
MLPPLKFATGGLLPFASNPPDDGHVAVAETPQGVAVANKQKEGEHHEHKHPFSWPQLHGGF